MKKALPILLIITFLTASVPQNQTADDEVEKVFQLLNELRAKGCNCGEKYFPVASELVWNENLAMAAERHAQDMFENDFNEHEGTDGTKVLDRALDAGYGGVAVGENIARGPLGDPVGLMGAWQASEGHCKNMMDPDFLEVGIAKVDNPENGLSYWVQVFGQPN